MSQIGFVVDGVLRPHSDINSVNPKGRLLFEGLQQFGRVTFWHDGVPGDEERLEQFLKLQRITGHVGIDVSLLSDGRDPVERRMAQVARLRRKGTIDFIVEPNPRIAAALLEAGLPALLYMHPQFMVPAWRPDFRGSVRRWDDVVIATDRQLALRADEDLREKETL